MTITGDKRLVNTQSIFFYFRLYAKMSLYIVVNLFLLFFFRWFLSARQLENACSDRLQIYVSDQGWPWQDTCYYSAGSKTVNGGGLFVKNGKTQWVVVICRDIYHALSINHVDNFLLSIFQHNFLCASLVNLIIILSWNQSLF